MNQQETNSSRQARRGGALGYSMVEVLVVIGIIMTIMAMAILKMQPTWQGFQATGAMTMTASQLRLARELAITERRNIQVTFTGTNTITLTRVLTLGMVANPNEPFGVFRTVQVSNPTQFMLTPGMPDTPDAFGNNGAIEFESIVGGPPTMMFQSDGTFVDGVGNLVNGTVFIGIPKIPNAARAITVVGATGRIRMYKGTGNGGWIQ